MSWEKQHVLEEKLAWIGLPEERIKQFKPFINMQVPGICGSYSAAALTQLVAETNQFIVDEMADLITFYEQSIEYYFPYQGTFWWDLQRGLNRYWRKYGYQSRFSIFTEKVVPNLLKTPVPKPVVVGTVRALGSPYRNHWLLVYAYAYDSTGKLWYRAYDNHGLTTAVIPAVQTLSAIWLEPVTLKGEKR